MTPERLRELVITAGLLLIAIGVVFLIPPGTNLISDVRTDWLSPDLYQSLINGALFTATGGITLVGSVFMKKE